MPILPLHIFTPFQLWKFSDVLWTDVRANTLLSQNRKTVVKSTTKTFYKSPKTNESSTLYTLIRTIRRHTTFQIAMAAKVMTSRLKYSFRHGFHQRNARSDFQRIEQIRANKIRMNLERDLVQLVQWSGWASEGQKTPDPARTRSSDGKQSRRERKSHAIELIPMICRKKPA